MSTISAVLLKLIWASPVSRYVLYIAMEAGEEVGRTKSHLSGSTKGSIWDARYSLALVAAFPGLGDGLPNSTTGKRR